MQQIYEINLSGVNVYLVENQGNYSLIDTGGHLYQEKIYSNR